MDRIHVQVHFNDRAVGFPRFRENRGIRCFLAEFEKLGLNGISRNPALIRRLHFVSALNRAF